MTPTKRFLYILGGIAVAGWIGINAVLGPPGLSKAYLAEYHHEHDHYLDVIKSDAYKHYVQRPHLFRPEEWEHLHHWEENLAFVERYEARPEFQAEEHRRERYSLAFELFNSGLVLAIALRFGRKPLLSFLDGRIAELRDRIESARAAREDIDARIGAVRERISMLPEEEHRVAHETERRLESELAALAEANHYSLGIMERELADRKYGEFHRATMKVKRELVEKAVAAVSKEFVAGHSPAEQSALVDQFIADMEAQA